MECIWVKAADPTRCALWETDPEHPVEGGATEAGEIFISGDEAFYVAKTAGVLAKLASGALQETKPPAAKARLAARAAQQEAESAPAEEAAAEDEPDDTVKAGPGRGRHATNR